MSSKTKIKYTRLATLHDTNTIVDIALEHSKTTAYGVLPANRAKLTSIVEKIIIETPHEGCMLVSVDDDDKVVGFLAGLPFEIVFSSETLGIEIGWFVRKDADDAKRRYLELREAFEEWARRKDLNWVQYAVLNPTDKDLKDVMKNKKSTVLELGYLRRVDKE